MRIGRSYTTLEGSHQRLENKIKKKKIIPQTLPRVIPTLIEN